MVSMTVVYSTTGGKKKRQTDELKLKLPFLVSSTVGVLTKT